MSSRIIISYIHDPPDKDEIPTRWRDPHFLSKVGFTDVVVGDQLSGCLALVMPNAEHSASGRLRTLSERVDAARAEGIGAWVMEDLFTLQKQGGQCPFDESLWRETATLVESMVERIPGISGFVFRFGEAFSTDAWARRTSPFSCGCERCAEEGLSGIFSRIATGLDETVCKGVNRRCILRVWDLGEDGFHANPQLLSSGLTTIFDKTELVVSVKHSMTDYWRYQPWNESIRTCAHPLLVEFQCEREYEFLGLVPNWLGHHWSQGFPEVDDAGSAGLANSTPTEWRGSYILPRGGGWSADHANDDLWSAINTRSIVELTTNPKLNPDQLLDDCLREEGFSDEESRNRFARLVIKSSDLVLSLRYLSTFHELTRQIWMPSHNWFRDDRFVPGACAHVTAVVNSANRTTSLLDEIRASVTKAKAHL